MESAKDFADKLLGMTEPIHPKYLAAVIERRDRVLAAAIRRECADRAVAWVNINGLLPLNGERELRAFVEEKEE